VTGAPITYMFEGKQYIVQDGDIIEFLFNV